MNTANPRHGWPGPWLAFAFVAASLPWTTRAQEPRAELRGHVERVEALAFSSDGKRLASGGVDRNLMIWDVEAGRLAEFQTNAGPVRGMMAGPIPITALAFAPEPPTDPLRLGARHRPERTVVATIGSDRSFSLWDADEGRAILRHHAIAKPIVSISFDAAGRMLATAAWDEAKGTRLFEIGTGIDRANYFEYVEMPQSVAFAPDGKRLALGDFNGRITILEFVTGGWIVRQSIQGHNDAVWALAFSSDGKRLATGGGLGRIRIWDAANGQVLSTIDAHRGGVRALAFSPGDALLASGGIDAIVRLWDVPGLITSGANMSEAELPAPDPKRIETENEQP